MKINRRNFLKTTALTSLYFAGFGVPTLANNKIKKNLVVIMLRGGMDGLCAIPIKNDKKFEKLRSKINLDRTLELTSDFDLHPSLTTFKSLWDQDLGAAVHATNIPYTGRSHFDGQNLMESGGKIPYQEKTGWLGRGMKIAGLTGEGLALALPMPLLIRGVPMNNNYYPVGDRLPSKMTLGLIEQAFKDHDERLLGENLKIVMNRDLKNLGSRENWSLASNAGEQLSKTNGPRVAVFEVDGFDTHAAQGGTNGAHADCLNDYDRIVKGLKQSMSKEAFDNTLIVTLTEFGRTIKQNGSNGTEHGYGSAILMAGGLLKKAQVHTDWPGLKKKELFEGRDLNSTIDARSVYASAMSTVFDVEFDRIQKDVFWGDKLDNLSDKLFKA
ncbi:DUF1501 domain-containing protein [Candidatus Pelagibacter sp. HIMB1748]|uniref:DUF1501 domain-containing protein n=1 Tax=unclassified Candidatus Pelagibacter TaxID=2647897 RepID=UPI003F8246B9